MSKLRSVYTDKPLEFWIAVKNKTAKEDNREPFYYIRKYQVDHLTLKAVVLKNGKQYPLERCFNTKEEAQASVGDKWKYRTKDTKERVY